MDEKLIFVVGLRSMSKRLSVPLQIWKRQLMRSFAVSIPIYALEEFKERRMKYF
jgi:hypothetical protein